jgi:hypothetical protein
MGTDPVLKNLQWEKMGTDPHFSARPWRSLGVLGGEDLWIIQAYDRFAAFGRY